MLHTVRALLVLLEQEASRANEQDVRYRLQQCISQIDLIIIKRNEASPQD
jgi:hypothetical protein